MDVRTAEVVVVGGGIIGVSVAYHLSRAGCRGVVVLEKDRVGEGATGKSAGGIRQQFSTEVNVRLSMESVKFVERFEEETGYSADFRQHGYLLLATTDQELQDFQRNVALQRELGLEVHLLSPEEAKNIVPELNTEDIAGATYCPTDGYADPYSLTQGFVSCAKRFGAQVCEETEVTGIVTKGGKVRGVVTTDGEISAPIVVNAAGPHASLLGRMVGADIPIRPSRRHVFVSAPTDIVRKDCPMVVDFHTGFWFRREGPGLIFGMRNPQEQEGFDISVDWGWLRSLAPIGSHRLPLLENTGISRAWAGLHSDTSDCNAILGQIPEVEGFICAVGFSGHGFMHSPMVGKAVAELILGEKASSVDISPLALSRFGAGECKVEQCFI